MVKIKLKNGNLFIIESLRYTYNKCIFTYSIYQKDGYWKYSDTDNFNIDYYSTIEDYISSNF